MASHSGPKRPSRLAAALTVDLEDFEREFEAEQAFKRDFVGPQRPRKPSGAGRFLAELLDPDSDLRRRFAPRPPHLSTEKAQQLSRRRWLANDIAKAEALEHVMGIPLRSRAAAAREIVEFLKRRTGKPVTVETADAWLKAAGWSRPAGGGDATQTPRNASLTG